MTAPTPDHGALLDRLEAIVRSYDLPTDAARVVPVGVDHLDTLLRLARGGLALRDAVHALAGEMETVADDVTPEAVRHTRTNSSNRRQRGYAAALRHAAASLRAVVADTSGEA